MLLMKSFFCLNQLLIKQGVRKGIQIRHTKTILSKTKAIRV